MVREPRVCHQYGRNGYELKAWADPLYGNSGWSRIIKSTDCYFKVGLTWSRNAANRTTFRIVDVGFVIDVNGSFIPCALGPSLQLLGVLNSSFCLFVKRLLNPTISFQVGDVCKVPVPREIGAKVESAVERATELERCTSKEDETTYDFIAPPVWPDGIDFVTVRRRQLADLEKEIDQEVCRLYDISSEDRRAIEEELSSASGVEDEDIEDEVEVEEGIPETEADSMTARELARRWVSYAVGLALGRFAPGEPLGLGRGSFPSETSTKLRGFVNADGLMILHRDHPDDLAQRVVDILTVIHGEAGAADIVRTGIGDQGDLRDTMAGYLLGPFFKLHVKLYRKRPVYWLLQSPRQYCSVYVYHERATDQSLAVIQGKRYVGGRIFQIQQQLDEANRKEAVAQGREKAQLRKRAEELADELADIENFAEAIDATNNETIRDADGQPATAHWAPELDDGVLLNAAPLYRLTPAWKRADPKLDLSDVWKTLKQGKYPWAKTAMRYWPRETLAACKENRSYRIAHGLE